MLDTFMKEKKGVVVEDVVVEEEVEEREADEKKEEVTKDEAEQLVEKEEEEKEGEEKKDEEVATPIKQASPPTLVAEVTTFPGKLKASKKRMTRSRK